MQALPIPSSPPTLATTNSLHVFLDSPILNISLKQNHIRCDIVCLALSLSVIFSRFIHVIAHISTSFLLMAE